ncbi:hypothetical protein GIB67_012845 [Kingdonia uniflora]|uniref:Transmembrane 9 superfamily member n=1 Tax=Kingdonia uniflora TaxID=39325 RepID=A0A7J7NGF0_9MAGN|nr:hypothetical protein GIB67_012845 [Kingdonia uniflora]
MAEKVQKGVFIIVLALVISVRPVVTSSADHRYSVGDNVPLYANKVGPLNNPSETYEYFDFPFCLPDLGLFTYPLFVYVKDQVIRKKESLGEVLNGDRFTNSMYELKFREDKTNEDLCKKTLTREEVAKFRDSVRNEFYFQMYYDNLPLWGFIGKVEDPWILNATGPRYYLFKHVNFDILFNKDRVIEIYAFNDPNHAVDISEDNETNIQFTYSVFWKATSAEFEKRMQRYSKSSLLPKHFQIHWFSIINSIAIIVLLVGLFSTLFLRTLKNDLKKCSNEDEDEDTEKEELSWKNLHGDVFRFPPHTSLFCAILATGTQILTMISFVFVLSFLGVLYPFNRGALYTFIVAIYAATSVLAGYNAASFRAKLAGPRQAVVCEAISYVFAIV